MKNPTFLLATLLAAQLAAQKPPLAPAKDTETQVIVLSVSGMT